MSGKPVDGVASSGYTKSYFAPVDTSAGTLPTIVSITESPDGSVDGEMGDDYKVTFSELMDHNNLIADNVKAYSVDPDYGAPEETNATISLDDTAKATVMIVSSDESVGISGLVITSDGKDLDNGFAQTGMAMVSLPEQWIWMKMVDMTIMSTSMSI